MNLQSGEESSSSSTTNADPTTRLHGLLRSILPACQPQEGSPANTFTQAELRALQEALTQIKEHELLEGIFYKKQAPKSLPPEQESNQLDILGWGNPNEEDEELVETISLKTTSTSASYDSPRVFREAVRAGLFTGPTNSTCPGYLQCNMVVLPAGKVAFDFLLFCQRNPKACPLLEVCESFRSTRLAPGADLRTDIPRYAIYRDGKLDETVLDATEYWPEHAVTFLIGCSFSYDGALQDAGIPLKSANLGRNVPMYETNIPCEPAGSLQYVQLLASLGVVLTVYFPLQRKHGG